MTQSRCICSHDEFEHARINGRVVCSGDFGECDCTRFEWDEECPDVE